MRLGKNAELGARFFFSADVNFRRRVFADAHERQARLHAARFQRGDAGGKFALDLRGDGAPVNEIRGRHYFDHLDALDGDDRRVPPAFVQAFLARHDDAQAFVAAQVEIGRTRVKVIDGLARVRVNKSNFVGAWMLHVPRTMPSC